jgi:hypothetical protein
MAAIGGEVGRIEWEIGIVSPEFRWKIMQRLLTLLPLCVALPLAGCWHEAFHTSIENATGEKIYVTIHFDVEGMPAGHGYVEPGNGVDFPQKIEKIGYIENQIDGRKCRIEKQAIAELTHAQGRGINHITLRDCGKPTL